MGSMFPPPSQVRRSVFTASAFALLSLGFLSSSTCAQQTDTQTDQALEGLVIRPSATDAAIKDFDDPHWVYVSRDIVVKHDAKLPADRHELLLWIPGTRSRNAPEPQPGRVSRAASHEFCKLAATLGYHVIALSYPNTISASACRLSAWRT